MKIPVLSHSVDIRDGVEHSNHYSPLYFNKKKLEREYKIIFKVIFFFTDTLIPQSVKSKIFFLILLTIFHRYFLKKETDIFFFLGY